VRAQNVVAVLASGGLDSCALMGDLARKRTVVPLYIRQGLAWEKAELYWLKKFLKALKNPKVRPLQIFNLPMGDLYPKGHWSLPAEAARQRVARRRVPGCRSDDRAVYLAGRNLALGVKAAVFCVLNKIPAIALGSLGRNPFPDASRRFFRRWAGTLSMGLHARLAIKTPYRALSKSQVIKRGEGFPLALSFSCLAPVGKKHCGRCNKCAERRKAFLKAGVEDATSYSLARAKRGRGD